MIMIAALTKDRVIGQGNGLPWRISEELRHFKRVTLGHTLIMGRKTFEAIGRPLPGRKTVVVSRSLPPAEGVDVCRSLDAAVEKACAYGKKVFIAGGASIYRQALPTAETLYLSYIKKDYRGDFRFPEFDEGEWEIAEEEDHAEFTFVIYRRKERQKTESRMDEE